MKAWDIFTWDFPDAGPHPAVVLGLEARISHKPKINVLLCSSQRTRRMADIDEVVLDESDGLDWPTLCKCDLVYSVPRNELSQKRGSVTVARRRQIAERVIRALGFAGM
jgi:mRNA-degrading endonuclease toxin of MazEF toxin-antitoxin module